MKHFLAFVVLMSALTAIASDGEISAACLKRIDAKVQEIHQQVQSGVWNAESGELLIKMQANMTCPERFPKIDDRSYCVKETERVQKSREEILSSHEFDEASRSILLEMQNNAEKAVLIACGKVRK